MSSKSKMIGTKWETDTVNYLVRWFPNIHRRVMEGRFDKGDLRDGPSDFTLENKDTKQLDIPGQLREAEKESITAGTRFYALLRKQRRGKLESGSTGRGLFIMRIERAAVLLWEYDRMVQLLTDMGYKPESWEWKDE